MPTRYRSLAQSLGGFGTGRPGGPEVPRRGAAKTGRITTTRPASTKLRRASQRWAGVLVRPSMVRSSAVNGPGASPGAGWLGVACGYAAITPSGVMTERAGQACCIGVTDASMSQQDPPMARRDSATTPAAGAARLVAQQRVRSQDMRAGRWLAQLVRACRPGDGR